MRERAIEARLRLAVARLGGRAFKWVSPGTAGVPDRIVLLPGGRVIFAELKAPGGRLSALQRRRIEELRSLGFVAVVLDSPEAVDRFVKEIAQLPAASQIVSERREPP